MADTVRLSKFIALILRHKAQDYGLSMDSNGFVSLPALYNVIHNELGNEYSSDDVLEVVLGDKQGKKRYEIVDNNIRAMFGHSNGVVTINYPTVIPPEKLFHGTSVKALDSIKLRGLETQNRQYVHLTTNYEGANLVAKRHDNKTIVLVVNSDEAYKDGIIFHQPEREHYLSKYIPPQYINFE